MAVAVTIGETPVAHDKVYQDSESFKVAGQKIYYNGTDFYYVLSGTTYTSKVATTDFEWHFANGTMAVYNGVWYKPVSYTPASGDTAATINYGFPSAE